MEKTIGYELLIKNERGFDGARLKMFQLIQDGIVKCGQCDCPATHIFFQDQAEFYIRCDQHREYGPQWTGSTRWNPTVFSLNVLKDKAEDWLSLLPSDQRKKYKIRSFDATNYYDLLTEDYWKNPIRHYLAGAERQEGWQVYVDIMPLKNGEFVYEIHKGFYHAHGGTGYTYAIEGAWPTEAEALEAAKADKNAAPKQS
jgi:hypothetical protein